MGKVMRHTLGASLNIRHNLSSSKGPKPMQLKLLTPTYQRRAPLRLPLVPRNGCGRPGRARSEERFSRNAETDLVCRLLLEKQNKASSGVNVHEEYAPFNHLNKDDNINTIIERAEYRT